MKRVGLMAVLVALLVPASAGAQALSMEQAKWAVRAYIADTEARGYSSGGKIDWCHRRAARWVGCQITEYDVEIFGTWWEEASTAVSAVSGRRGLLVYDSLAPGLPFKPPRG